MTVTVPQQVTPEQTMPFFNLVDEPWLPVIGADGRQTEVSLRQAFRQAQSVRRLVGELPTQAFVHLRLLLAVLHRAVGGPTSLDHWRAVRDDPAGTVRLVEQYLDNWHDRFWLRHPTAPFFQAADLRTAKGEVFGLSRIVCDGPGTSAFMTTRLGENLETATWPEAARWLIHVHAYDVSGIHSGAVGDPRVKGGKGYGIGTGWAGQIGGVHLLGVSLWETLLLNLVATAEIDLAGGPDDLPVWERAPLDSAPEGWTRGINDAYREPTGPVDVYTWPTRRVRLFGDAERCTGVINAQGDRARPQNRFRVEPMTAWRYSEPQTKAAGQDTYMPAKHIPARAFWRGLAALLPGMSEPARRDGPATRRPPGVLDWAAVLQLHEDLGRDLLQVQAVGVEYGSNESMYDDLVADGLTLPTALLSPGAEGLARAAVAGVRCAEQAVYALGSLAENIALAAGASSEDGGPRNRASALAYDALDREFRSWLRTLDAASDPLEREKDWQRTVREVIARRAAAVVNEAGSAALVGRVVAKQFRDVGVAERWFWRRLREVLPHAFDDGPTVAQDVPTDSQEVS
jgi:CRISPR system Cascade subunit CasA